MLSLLRIIFSDQLEDRMLHLLVDFNMRFWTDLTHKCPEYSSVCIN